MHEEYALFKILVVGSSGVGKTCILLRYTDSIYKETYGTTIGVDFKMKNILVNDKAVKLQLWDTAGQERFRTITSSYYRNANGILLVFDISDEDSFNDLKGWISEISNNINNNIIIFILANKIDTNTVKVSDEDISNFISKYKTENINIIGYNKVSAKTGEGIDLSFKTIAESIMISIPDNKIKQRVNIESDDNINGWCCIN
ncbi:rab-protein 1-PB [Nematocida parisii ERTm1]|uniref:Rab-protein 1-PB n=1 Tax=Nematocida parisii (strain ERTm3) TaxID=935791 RepID=I3EH04_NEMP3|nr:rab-protein 1-PB [Nematocida parisii ERTm1]EIJ88501.1 rab-protein 1-PB [Nematocida parisii ERTm3]EIJ94749.1 rab-protein 1-PB [Nematocida parisii ERTm1]|eukprot:XP_013058105.1 rab-protein 1-PB [Nematocida parisii ERTm1]